MSLLGFDELFAATDAREGRVSVAAAGGDDPTVLVALQQAQQRGWVKPYLCGDAEKIRQVAESAEVDLAAFEVCDSEAPAITAVDLVRSGEAKLLMKGQIPTPDLMKAVLRSEGGLRTGKTICQVVLMEIPKDNRRFLLSDTGITICPSIQQASDIVDAAASVARSLQCDVPRIAIMAASEKQTDAMPETHLAAQLKEYRGAESDLVIDGPLSFDLAYSDEAGRKKRLSGDAIGIADAMVFPNLLSANLTVKSMMYAADCRFGGLLCGTTSPVVFMSTS